MSDGRVMVIGGTGFIGSRIVGALAALGKPVRCLVRDSESPREGVEEAVALALPGDVRRTATAAARI